tara:strand:- start:1944 stop:3182 length:1239 start_codon:yes stop_codon:yes gene_type:complete
MSKGIKSAAERLAISKAAYKSKSYDIAAQQGLLKLGINNLNQREQARQNFLAFSGQFINYLDKLNQYNQDNKIIEDGIAQAEVNLGIKVNYQRVGFDDVLRGDAKIKDLGKETFLFGNKEYSRAQLKALGRTVQENEMAILAGEDVEPVDLSGASGWTFAEGESKAIVNSSKDSLKLGVALNELVNEEAAKKIYEDYGGIKQWSTAAKVVENLLNKDPDLAVYGKNNQRVNLKERFTTLRDTINNELNSDVVKRKANEELQQIYSQISQKYSWDEIKGEIAQAESGNNPYAININEDGRGFDVGKYQINSRYLVGGEGSYELNADGTPSQMFADIQQILDKGLVGVEVEQKSSYTGKKPGFDMGDLVGKDSIFNKEVEIDYGFEDKNIYETLYDNNLIDENWNMYDYNLENK